MARRAGGPAIAADVRERGVDDRLLERGEIVSPEASKEIIETLKLAEEAGIGTRDLKRIEVVGVPIRNLQFPFRRYQ